MWLENSERSRSGDVGDSVLYHSLRVLAGWISFWTLARAGYKLLKGVIRPNERKAFVNTNGLLGTNKCLHRWLGIWPSPADVRYPERIFRRRSGGRLLTQATPGEPAAPPAHVRPLAKYSRVMSLVGEGSGSDPKWRDGEPACDRQTT